jgi:carotenoid cleavage dioxygenase-like enzyme
MADGFQQGFQTLASEVQIESLPVRGRFPGWLRGTLIRNGPAAFEAGAAAYRHWFDGLAMLHAFSFDSGRVAYGSRYLRSPAYLADTAAGKIHYRGFATAPCRSLFSRIMALFIEAPQGVNTNVSVTKLADACIAMTETPLSIQFDPQTLATLGVFGYDDALAGQVTTAHPHHDFERGAGYNYLLTLGRSHAYQIIRLDGARRTRITALPVRQPAYMHSFGMTARYLILAEFSFRLPSAIAVLVSGRPFIENYAWQPDAPTRFLIVDKDSGALAAVVEAEPFFAFHHINAFERGGEIVLDIAAYPDASIIQDFYLARLRAPAARTGIGQLRRYRLPLRGGRAVHEVVSPEPLELPRIHYRRANGRDYRWAYAVGMRADQPDFPNQLVKVDVTSGDTAIWRQDGCYPGEPVFVPAPDAAAEDEGLILSVVLDAGWGRSFLLALDGQTFTEAARAEAPHGIPFGFHGQFFE